MPKCVYIFGIVFEPLPLCPLSTPFACTFFPCAFVMRTFSIYIYIYFSIWNRIFKHCHLSSCINMHDDGLKKRVIIRLLFLFHQRTEIRATSEKSGKKIKYFTCAFVWAEREQISSRKRDGDRTYIYIELRWTQQPSSGNILHVYSSNGYYCYSNTHYAYAQYIKQLTNCEKAKLMHKFQIILRRFIHRWALPISVATFFVVVVVCVSLPRSSRTMAT